MTDLLAFKNRQLPVKARIELGRSFRKQVPRSSHGDWTPAANRPNPISLLQEQDKGRLQQLLPIKYGRMVASPFAFPTWFGCGDGIRPGGFSCLRFAGGFMWGCPSF